MINWSCIHYCLQCEISAAWITCRNSIMNSLDNTCLAVDWLSAPNNSLHTLLQLGVLATNLTYFPNGRLLLLHVGKLFLLPSSFTQVALAFFFYTHSFCQWVLLSLVISCNTLFWGLLITHFLYVKLNFTKFDTTSKQYFKNYFLRLKLLFVNGLRSFWQR